MILFLKRFKNIKLHEYIVMPNHFHAILEIVGATLGVAQNYNNVVAQNETNAHRRGNPCGRPIKYATTEKGQPQGLPLRKNKTMNKYIVMPNHFHAILEIVGATLVVAQ